MFKLYKVCRGNSLLTVYTSCGQKRAVHVSDAQLDHLLSLKGQHQQHPDTNTYAKLLAFTKTL